MNIITFRLHDIHERKVVVAIQNNNPKLRRIIFFLGVFYVSSILLFLLRNSFGPTIFYRLILEIVLFIVAAIGMIYGGYGLINTLYERPIMILTPNNIYLGIRLLFRSPHIKPSGIIPKDDMQLIIVRDSKFHLFKVFLEGRKLLQLGIYKTLNEAKDQRIQLRKSLADFYPHIYISMPKYHEI